MNFSNSFAYIPLFAIAGISLVVFILLLLVRGKKTARISFISLLGIAVLGIGSAILAVIQLTDPDNDQFMFIYFAAVFGSLFLFLPYSIILLTFEPKKIEKLVSPKYNQQIEKVNTIVEAKEKLNGELGENDKTMLDISQQFMVKASECFNADNNMNALLDYVNTTIRENIQADGGAILMVDDFEDVVSVKSFDGDFPPPYKLPPDMPHKPVRVATNFKFATFPFKDNLFGDIVTKGKSELITKPERDDRIYQNGPEEFLECGSYIVVPMKNNDAVIGLAAFARKRGNIVFTEDELKTAEVLSGFAAAAIKIVIAVKEVIERNDVSKEANIASKIQEMLKPAKLPVINGLQIGSYFNPVEGVCGDYYDVMVSRKDRISFVMSDIAGKGLNSMVVMTMLRAMIRLVVNTTQSAGKILSWVNRGISGESFSTDHFGSCALINYNPVEQQIEFSTGGTTPVLYWSSRNQSFTQISVTSEPIGVEKSTEYKDFVQKVESGDIIVTYTDGLVESLNDKGQQYGRESLERIIKSNNNSSGKDIANLIKADVKNFTGDADQYDDQSLLVIKIQ